MRGKNKVVKNGWFLLVSGWYCDVSYLLSCIQVGLILRQSEATGCPPL